MDGGTQTLSASTEPSHDDIGRRGGPKKKNIGSLQTHTQNKKNGLLNSKRKKRSLTTKSSDGLNQGEGGPTFKKGEDKVSFTSSQLRCPSEANYAKPEESSNQKKIGRIGGRGGGGCGERGP